MTLKKKHDPLSRKFLSDLIIAKEFLMTHLAPEMLVRCKIDTLRIESGSYIDEDLKTNFADIVYGLELKENKGSVYIYTLVEQQSKAVRLMPFRIIKYQLAIIQKHLDEHKGSKLPIVVPLVFYSGITSPYPYSSDIADLFTDAEIYAHLPLGKFRLVDLSVIDDDEILRHGKLAVLEILLKHIHQRDFMKLMQLIIKALQVGHDNGINENQLNGAFSYLMHAREDSEIKELFIQVKEKLSYYEENIMNYAETLKKEGIQLGEQKAQLQIAKDLLKSGVDSSVVAKSTHLTKAQIEELKHYIAAK